MKLRWWFCTGGMLALLGLLVFLQIQPESVERKPRPAAGDQVQPRLEVVGDWQAGAKAHFIVRLGVRGPQDAAPEFLLNQDVPEDFQPNLRVAFFQDERELSPAPPFLVERCC